MPHRSSASLPEERKGSRRKSFRRTLFVLTLLALLLRLAVSWELASAFGGCNNVFTPSPSSDLATYRTLAQSIVSGIYSGPFYYQPFYYAVFLPVLYFLSGSSVIFVCIVQALCGTLCVWFSSWCALLIFRRRSAAILAGCLTALSTPLLLYVPYHQNETLQSLLLTLLAFLTLRGCRKSTPARWAAAGFFCGLAVLTRGNALLFLPLLLFLAWRSSRKNKLRHAALLLVFCLLPQLPFIAYNTRVTGHLCGPSTAANAVLALGNTPEAPPGGRNPGLPAGAMYYPESYHRMMALTQKGISIPRQMLSWLCREPGTFLELQFRKLLLFWEYHEIPNNVSLYTDGQLSFFIRFLLPGRSAVLLTLCVAGLFFFASRLVSRKENGLVLLYGMLLIYWFAVAAFYILSRFRAPILPLAAVMGGGFAADAWERLKQKKGHTRSLLCVGSALVCGVFFVCAANDFYRDNCEAAVQKLLRPHGVRIDFEGKDVQYFDHGPFPFGGWKNIPLQPESVLEKQFCLTGSPKGECLWSVVTPAPGTLLVRVNGETHSFDIPQPNRIQELRFPVTLEDGRLRLEVVFASSPVAALFDTQRQYGRSFWNVMPLQGEWIVRFLQPKPLKK